jgi:tRNA1Val (adenine37-N6)-methyltransferase
MAPERPQPPGGRFDAALLPGLLHDDESLDELRPGGLRVIQKQAGYRFSLDPVLLCAFARIGRGERVCDLGTGCGVIPLLLAQTTAAGSILGVEVQADMADRARRSVLLNHLRARVTILHEDLRAVRNHLAAESCQAVLSNPPYRRPDSGRRSPHDERARARHELCGGLEDFLACAAWLLGTGGRFYMVYLAERLAELLAGMRQVGLEPKRLRCVHSRAGDPARLVLVEGRRGGAAGLVVESPLQVYDGESYSAEVRAMYGDE